MPSVNIDLSTCSRGCKFLCVEDVGQLVNDALVDIGQVGDLSFDVGWVAEILEGFIVDEDNLTCPL